MKAIDIACSQCKARPGEPCSEVKMVRGSYENRTVKPHRGRKYSARLATEADKRARREARKAAGLQASQLAQGAAVYTPPCALAMGCLCALHAREPASRAPCDAAER